MNTNLNFSTYIGNTAKGNIAGSVANIVCAFDVMGFAVEAPFDEMSITVTDKAGVINITHTDEYNLPTDLQQNVAGVALQALLAHIPDAPIGINLVIHKNIKPGSGLGSSAASAAGAVLLANEALNDIFTKAQLVQFAMEGEALASGARHADNLAPCIYNGITIVRSIDPIDVITIPAPEIYVTLLHPQIEIKTAEARSILPKEITLKTASMQWANVAALVAGFLQSDYALISRSLSDSIVEPVRSRLIPYFDEVKAASLQAGALGGGISGSGPTIFMLSQTAHIAHDVATAMHRIYADKNIAYNIHETKIKS